MLRCCDRDRRSPLHTQGIAVAAKTEIYAATLRSVHCPRRCGPFDILRRAATELGAFLLTAAPGGGHDPAALQAEHMHRFVADMRRREREGLPSLMIIDAQGKPSPVTAVTRSCAFNALRRLLRTAMDNGAADRLGLDRGFIVAVPYGDTPPKRARAPFSDEVARAGWRVVIIDDVVVQVISAARPEWIQPFTGLQPAPFRKLVRLVARHSRSPGQAQCTYALVGVAARRWHGAARDI